MTTTDYPNNRFPDGSRVRVTDTGRNNRRYLARVLHVHRIDDHGVPDAWEVELRNGNRGWYDLDHIEAAPITTTAR